MIDLGLDVPTQPMTCSRVQGDLSDVQQEISRIVQAFESHGFPVTRIKAEAAPWNSLVPTTDAQAQQHPDHYFEFHAKVQLMAEQPLESLKQVCQQQGAHLSSNAFQKAQDAEQRFITLRLPQVGLQTAQLRSEELCGALQEVGFEVLKTVMEHCFLDSHLELDGGGANDWGTAEWNTVKTPLSQNSPSARIKNGTC